MFRNMKIGWRMAVLILAGAGCILGIIIGYSYVTARRLLQQELEEKARYLAEATAYRMETVQRSVEKSTEGIAMVIEEQPSLSRTDIYRLMRKTVEANSGIYGTAYALPPSKATGNQFQAYYVYHDGKTVKAKDATYQFDAYDWFTLPRDLRRPVWTEPYFGPGGGTLMVTYSIPIFADREHKIFRGIVESDVALSWLTDLFDHLHVGKNGYAFLISANGTYIAHKRKDLIMNESVFSVAEAMPDERDRVFIRALGQRMIRHEAGFVALVSVWTHKQSWLAFAPVPSTGWSLSLVFPREELLEKVLHLSRVELAVGLVGFGLLLVLVLGVAQTITRPIGELEKATRTLAGGNLDTPLPVVPGGDEVAHLAASFATMRDDLKSYLENLRETTAAKERIESEITIARSIQMGLVPKTFPPFPERDDFEIYAMLDPARQIGGDFYDFFMRDDEHLCFVIGDVSGKGVPAALFMAVTRTFLKSLWRDEVYPGRTLDRLNRELAQDNDSNMFVTLFCGVLHLPTGYCRFANGGHNPPFILRADGSVDKVPKVKGALVGVMEGVRFEEGELTLGYDDTLFLYTDGVTEAMDPNHSLFGDQRTEDTLVELHNKDKDSVVLVKGVREVLRNYAEDAEQSDDITMLAMRYLVTSPVAAPRE